MKKRISLRSIVLQLCFVVPLLVCVSCGSDDEADPTTTPDTDDVEEVSAVSNLSIKDIANAGNASDIQVSFQGPANQSSINNYRVLVFKNGQAGGVALEGANAIAVSNVYELDKAGRDYFFTLPAEQVDTDGVLIEEGSSYQILVLSVALTNLDMPNALSEVSNEITLARQVEVTTLVSGFSANDALTVDSEGNIYASNFGEWSSTGGNGSTLLKVTPEGTVSTHLSGLRGPLGNAVDAEGNIYIIDDNNGSSGKVVKVGTDGIRTILAEVAGWPAGLAFDNEDNLYISNNQSSTLHKLTPDSNLSILAQDTDLNGAVGIVFDGTGLLYVANYNNGKILRVDLSGNVTEIVQLNVVANFGIGYITMLGNHLYATDIGNHKIYKIWIDGTFEVLAGTGGAGQANGFVPEVSFSNPNGIAADPDKNVLYVSDWGRPGLRKIQL